MWCAILVLFHRCFHLLQIAPLALFFFLFPFLVAPFQLLKQPFLRWFSPRSFVPSSHQWEQREYGAILDKLLFKRAVRPISFEVRNNFWFFTTRLSMQLGKSKPGWDTTQAKPKPSVSSLLPLIPVFWDYSIGATLILGWNIKGKFPLISQCYQTRLMSVRNGPPSQSTQLHHYHSCSLPVVIQMSITSHSLPSCDQCCIKLHDIVLGPNRQCPSSVIFVWSILHDMNYLFTSFQRYTHPHKTKCKVLCAIQMLWAPQVVTQNVPWQQELKVLPWLTMDKLKLTYKLLAYGQIFRGRGLWRCIPSDADLSRPQLLEHFFRDYTTSFHRVLPPRALDLYTSVWSSDVFFRITPPEFTFIRDNSLPVHFSKSHYDLHTSLEHQL